jgi:DNA-binding transcriptional LysR family regulator
VYLRHCVAMRDVAQAAAEAVAQEQTEAHGTVRLTCPVTLAHSTVGPLMPLFLRLHPAVRVEMRVLNRPVDLVEEGVDIALRVRPQIEDSATLVARNFGVSRGLLVAKPDLVLRQGPIEGPGDLSKLDTVSMSAADGQASWRLEGPDGKVIVHTHAPRYMADDLETLKFAVIAGTGASVLPDYMCRREIKLGQLVEVLPGWGPAPAITHAMFPARRALVPAVRRLIDFLVEHMNADEPHELAG